MLIMDLDNSQYLNDICCNCVKVTKFFFFALFGTSVDGVWKWKVGSFVVLKCVGFLVVVQVHKLIYVLGYGIVYSMGTWFHESCEGGESVIVGIANNMTRGRNQERNHNDLICHDPWIKIA